MAFPATQIRKGMAQALRNSQARVEGSQSQAEEEGKRIGQQVALEWMV